MTCPNCSYSIPSGMQYCPNCGNLLNEIATNSAGVPTQRIDSSTIPQQQRRITAPLEPLPEDSVTQSPILALPSSPASFSDRPMQPQVVPRGTLPNTSYVVPAPKNNSNAVVSLVFGILGWVILPLIGPIVAIVAGHIALRQIKIQEGQQDGRGMAIAGLVLGYLQIVVLIIACAIIAIGAFMFTQMQ